MLNPEKEVKELKKMMVEQEPFQLIDVREEHEYEQENMNGLLIPMGEITERLSEIRKDIPVIVHCRSGARSAAVVNALEMQYGFSNLYNLKGGILAWLADTDAAAN